MQSPRTAYWETGCALCMILARICFFGARKWTLVRVYIFSVVLQDIFRPDSKMIQMPQTSHY